MLRGNTVPNPWGVLTKYKCLVPAQNRLPNALAEEVEGGLNNLEIKLFVVFIFIMTFLHMCEILECIVGFYPIVFYLAHIVALRPDSTTAKFFARNCLCEIRMVGHE